MENPYCSCNVAVSEHVLLQAGLVDLAPTFLELAGAAPAIATMRMDG